MPIEIIFSQAAPNPPEPATTEAAVDDALQRAINAQTDPESSINTSGLLGVLRTEPNSWLTTEGRRAPLLLARDISLFAWVDYGMSQLRQSREALQCICRELERMNGPRMEVVSTITDRPVNISVSDGSPGPEIYAGGWVLFHDVDGNVGQRSYIFTQNQRHVSDLPNATGYTYHLMPGFTATFSP